MIRAALLSLGSACWRRVHSSRPTSRRFPGPNILGPMPSGRSGPTSTGVGSFVSTPTTRGRVRAGKSPVRRVTTARSSSRFRGRASCPAFIRSRMRPRSAGIAAASPSPRVFPSNERVWLRFGAVDWRADVWVNGRKVAEHEGGYTPFDADISDALTRDRENVLVVRAFDPTDPNLPTGKQVGWYTPSSGIWQTVWLEARPKTYIAGFRVVTAIEPASVRFSVDVAGFDKAKYQLAPREGTTQMSSAARSLSSPRIPPPEIRAASNRTPRPRF